MKRTYTYEVHYFLRGSDERRIEVVAGNKWDAYDKAVYEAIPDREGELPYSAWVDQVIYKNGRGRAFNTFEGNPV